MDINRPFGTQGEFSEENLKLTAPLPYAEEVSVLGQPLSLGSKSVPNRLVCQAMEGCDGNADGTPGELTLRRYDRFAAGGAGLIWYEATAVLPEARANPRQLHINEQNAEVFARHVERIKERAMREQGTEPIVIMQATHSGRYSKPCGTPAPIIAYNNPIFEKDAPIDKSRIISDMELDRVGEALVQGAVLAKKAGFDGVDIKCCHRYLNSELLSAYLRHGRYGGSLENRTRLLCEAVAGAKAACTGDFIVTSRLNIYDGFPYPYGFGVGKDGGTEVDLSEPVRLVQRLEALGVELLNITMGNPYFNPHVNRPFYRGAYTPDEAPIEGVARMLKTTAELKKHTENMKLICSGLSYLGVAAPNVAAGFIKDGGFDLAGFGRMIFAYPSFARDILKNGGLDPKQICLACSKCTELMRAGSTPGCVLRDREVYLPLYQQFCGGDKK